jgi:hypothetical protein
MTTLILQDAQRRPELFDWRGPVNADELHRWLAANRFVVPADLVTFWKATGGGEAFETETLLAPIACESSGEDVEGVTREHCARGMPADYLVFHVGFGGLSVIRRSDARYLLIDDTKYVVAAEYATLDEWYRLLLRAEYEGRYRL